MLDTKDQPKTPLPSLPPGPDSPPWFQAQAWIERPVAFWRECAHRFGDTFTVQLGSIGPTVLFSDPQAVRQVFQLPPATFECHQFNDHYKYVMGEKSLLVSDGPEHQRRRKVVTPFLQGSRTQHFSAVIHDITRRVIDQWPSGEAFDVRPSIHALSLQVMLRIVFGSACEDIGATVFAVFKAEMFQDMGTWKPWVRFAELHRIFRTLISKAIHRQRSSPRTADASFLDALVAAADDSKEPIDEEEIQDQVFTLLVAGVDPAAIAITWAIYWILENPVVLKRLTEELNSLGADADPQQFAQLPYLKTVCQEALRMYPVVATPSGRKLTQEVEVVGRTYEPGVTLLPCTYLVHHREDIYTDAERFDPDRFQRRDYTPYEYFPFGGGTRTCIGAAMGYFEMQMALATIFRTWQLTPAHRGAVEPTRHGTLLAPSDTMRVIARRPFA